MILVRSERRLPPTKGISVGWEVASEARRVIQVRVVLGYVSVEPAAGAPPNLLNGVLTTLELSLSSSSTSVQAPDLGRGYRLLSEAPCKKARNFGLGSIKTRSGPGVPPHAESG